MVARNIEDIKKITKVRNSQLYKKCLSELSYMIVKESINARSWSNCLHKLRTSCEKLKISWDLVSVIVIEDLQKLREIKIY